MILFAVNFIYWSIFSDLFYHLNFLGDTRAEKRDLLQFASMIKCATNRNAIKYIDYGNYCGWGGKGKPVDEVDRSVL